MLNGATPMPSSMLKGSPSNPPPTAPDYDDEGETASEAADDVFEVEQKAVNFTNWLLVCGICFHKRKLL